MVEGKNMTWYLAYVQRIINCPEKGAKLDMWGTLPYLKLM